MYLNALQGKGVHLVTVNDYLAARDAEWMGTELYASSGCQRRRHPVSDLRHAAQARPTPADITYGTNNEFGFDYLRDNMKFSRGGGCSAAQLRHRRRGRLDPDRRGAHAADHQRPGDAAGRSTYRPTRHPASQAGTGLRSTRRATAVTLTDSASDKVEARLRRSRTSTTSEHMEVLHHVDQALKAHHLFKKDGPTSSRRRGHHRRRVHRSQDDGRRWSDGLHQAVEAKEGLKIQQENQTYATITLQNFFRLYKKLAGMTGTADTEAAEFSEIYSLDCIVIPTNRPSAQRSARPRLQDREREKFVRGHQDEIEAANGSRASRCWSAPPASRSQRVSPGAALAQAASRTTCSTPSSTPARPRSWRRRPAGLGHHRHQHGRPRHRHRARRKREGDGRGRGRARTRGRSSRLRSRATRSRARRSARRSSRRAGSSSSARSGTRAGASTTSSAAAPGDRAIPGAAASSLSLDDELMRIFGSDKHQEAGWRR
jgi:hypothetical protein